MGRRRKGTGRKAYLKRAKHSYDPYSPYALRTRGVKTINLAALVREPPKVDPKTGKEIAGRLVRIEYESTQTHGKRGLTLKRAVGPTASAPHTTGEPTLIPKAALMQKMIDVAEGKQQWASDRYSGTSEWHRIILRDIRPFKLEEYWFSGQRHKIVFTNYERGYEQRSVEYPSKDELFMAWKYKRLRWEETIELTPP